MGSLADACEDLRHFVENFNKVPDLAKRGKVFKALDPRMIQVVRVPPWDVGYRLSETLVGTMVREVFLRNYEIVLDEVDDKEIDSAMLTIFKVFFDQSEDFPEIFDMTNSNLDGKTMMFRQQFMPAFLVERNPRVLVPK